MKLTPSAIVANLHALVPSLIIIIEDQQVLVELFFPLTDGLLLYHQVLPCCLLQSPGAK